MKISNSAIKPIQVLIPIFISIFITFFSTQIVANAPHLQDYAKVVSAQKAEKLEALLSSLEAEHGVLVQEVILPSFAGRAEDVITDGFLQLLKQESPSIEKKVLVLIVLDENKAVIFNTANLATQMSDNLKNQIIKEIKVRVKTNQYDEAAGVGITKIAKAVKVTPLSNEKKFLNIVFFLIALGVVIGMIKYKKSV